MILGTAAYMSPEQAKGRPADKRSDIWAFGCVLYEMLTGRRPFDGEDVSEVLASVIKSEPDLQAFPSDVPRGICSIVARCLAKDRKARVPEISAVRFLIEDANRAEALPLPPPAQRSTWKFGAALIVSALLAAATTAWLVWTPRLETASPAVARFDIMLPSGQAVPRGVAISPDGQTIAYSASRQLYIRTMSDSMVRPATGTALTGYGPFFSPDGKWIGFYAPDDSSLKKIALTGGAPVTICKLDIPGGAVWTRDGQILVASGGILRVSANGGAPETLIAAKAGELMQGPQLLPDGNHLVFAVTTATGPDRWDRAQIVVQSLKSGERRVLVEGGSNPQLAITGHLIYALGATMLAVPFDAGRLAVTGSPIRLADQVAVAATGTSNIAIAGNGSIAHFIESEGSLRATKLALVDRAGARTLLPVPEGRYSFPRVSPDGQQIAVVNQDQGKASIWIHDVSGTSSMRRLTFESATTLVWTRDGRRIAFGSNRETGTALYWQQADGSGSEERLTDLERADRYFPNHVTADGASGVLLQSQQWRRPDDQLEAICTKRIDFVPLARRPRELFARRPMDGVSIERVGSLRDLRAALSADWRQIPGDDH